MRKFVTVNTASSIDLLERVEKALDSMRPHLRVDGGDVEVVEITDELALHVRWKGTCETCKMSLMTLRAGIEQAVKSQVPEITSVLSTNGLNPTVPL